MAGDAGGDSDSPTPEYGETWVYESIVGAIPGVDLSPTAAVTVQFLLFEGAMLALAAGYDLWSAVPAGTAAVGVAAAGSYLMLALSREIRASSAPPAYPRLLFGTSIEVVLGVLAFVALVTALLAGGAGVGRRPLLTALLGPALPVPAVYLALLVLWDLCYRIGTGWWASVVGLSRSVRYRRTLDAPTRARLRRADLLTIGFALVQLALVPFVGDRPVLLVAIVGHVLAVTVVSGASVVLLSRSA
ncbi:DUF7530 family protein [Halorussus marinus]|uniref:DUF7530 family protein n=1 Tax=Halorussus marinus TaxID=2505976 RepID=UPI00106DD48A|nr:hypothetical protein [Halorussus marinus]